MLSRPHHDGAYEDHLSLGLLRRHHGISNDLDFAIIEVFTDSVLPIDLIQLFLEMLYHVILVAHSLFIDVSRAA